jgi:hypothetical protein
MWAGYGSYLVRARPTHRDVAHGLVYPFPAHGPPVYVSLADLFLVWGLAAAAAALFAVFNVLRRRDERASGYR